MGEDPGDHGQLLNGDDDLQSATAVRLALDIDVEDARLALKFGRRLLQSA